MEYFYGRRSSQGFYHARASSLHFERASLVLLIVALLRVGHLGSVVSASALDFGGGRYAPRCEPIKVSMCMDMRYNMTQMPNYVGKYNLLVTFVIFVFFCCSRLCFCLSLPVCLSWSLYLSFSHIIMSFCFCLPLRFNIEYLHFTILSFSGLINMPTFFCMYNHKVSKYIGSKRHTQVSKRLFRHYVGKPSPVDFNVIYRFTNIRSCIYSFSAVYFYGDFISSPINHFIIFQTAAFPQAYFLHSRTRLVYIISE